MPTTQRRVSLQQKRGYQPVFEEFGTVSGGRDPRGWSLSVIYFALVPPSVLVGGGVVLFPVDTLPPLSFDHADIITQVVARIRSSASYSSLPMHLCAEELPSPNCMELYQSIMGVPLAMAGFQA